MISIGDYLATAVDSKLGYTGGGREQIGIEFKVKGGEFNGHSITWYGFFGDEVDSGGKTRTERTEDDLRKTGWTGADISDLAGIGSRDCNIAVEHDEYQGKVKPKVRWINAAGGIAMKTTMDAEQAKRFAASLKKGAQKVNGGKPPTRPSAPPEREDFRPPGGTEDDIPF